MKTAKVMITMEHRVLSESTLLGVLDRFARKELGKIGMHNVKISLDFDCKCGEKKPAKKKKAAPKKKAGQKV